MDRTCGSGLVPPRMLASWSLEHHTLAGPCVVGPPLPACHGVPPASAGPGLSQERAWGGFRFTETGLRQNARLRFGTFLCFRLFHRHTCMRAGSGVCFSNAARWMQAFLYQAHLVAAKSHIKSVS